MTLDTTTAAFERNPRVGVKRKANNPPTPSGKRRRGMYAIGLEVIHIEDFEGRDVMSYHEAFFETEQRAKRHVINLVVHTMKEELQGLVMRADASNNDDVYLVEGDDEFASLVDSDGRPGPDFDFAYAIDVYRCIIAHFKAMNASTPWKTIDTFLDNAVVELRRKLKCGYLLNHSGSPGNGLVRVLYRNCVHFD